MANRSERGERAPGALGGRLQAGEIASRAGVTVERISELVGLGLLDATDGSFAPEDVGRVGVIEALVAEGVPIEEMAGAARSGVVSFGWFGGLLPPTPTLSDRTYREKASDIGMSVELIERLFELWGLAGPPADSRLREDDEQILDLAAGVYEAFGRDEDLLMDSMRYFGDNLRRVAESQIAFFRREILEPQLAAGRTLQEIVERANPFITNVVRPAVRELLVWLHRRHTDAFLTQMLVQAVETALQDAGVEIRSDRQAPAIAFLDLTGFTRLTDEAGDEQAVALATTLTDMVRSAPLKHGGEVVKLLGDGVMFHFSNAAGAVRCALHLVGEAVARGLPPARFGVHAGPLVFRDGDYFGRTVNVAARITDYARPQEVLVSQAALDSMDDVTDLTFDAIGPVALRGVFEPVVLHSARAIGVTP